MNYQVQERKNDYIQRFVNDVENICEKTDVDIVILALINEWLQLARESIVLMKTETSFGHIALRREMFEIIVYIKYILQQDSDFRAKCYLYFVFKNELISYSRLNKNSKEYRDLVEIFPDFEMVAFNDEQNEVTEKINQIENIIKSERFNLVRSALSNCKNKNPNSWYFSLEPQNRSVSFSKLAKSVDMEGLYKTIYSAYCCQTHASRAIRNYLSPSTSFEFSKTAFEFEALLTSVFPYYFDNPTIKKIIKTYFYDTEWFYNET